VEPAIARKIASQSHVGHRDRFGDPVIDHVERVAAAVPADARATALLDLFELWPTVGRRLRGQGLTRTELEALELLRHAAGEPYEVYVRRIADASGAGGTARADREARRPRGIISPTRRSPSDAPPYAWAREQPRTARDRAVQAAPGTPSRTPRPAARRSGGASNPPRRSTAACSPVATMNGRCSLKWRSSGARGGGPG
jgi:hypothetical protein